MLPKPNRLPSPDIARVLKDGNRIMRGPIIVVYKENNSVASRFSFVVSTGVDKRAVVRNRMKRLLRESVQHILPDMKYKIDAAVIVRSAFDTAAQEKTEHLFRNIFSEAKLLK